MAGEGRVVRILNLGGSGSRGSPFVDRANPWPVLVQTELEPKFGPIQFVDRAFVPNGAGALAFVERLLGDHHPDVVIAHPNVYAFVMSDVEQRLRGRFGERTATLFKRAERRFDRTATRLGGPGRLALRGTKAIARRVIGTASILDPAVALATWLETLDRLARDEGIEVILTSATGFSAGFQRLYPDAAPATARFNAALRARCERHHFAWLDQEDYFAEVPGGREACFAFDLVHKSAAGAPAEARAIAAAIEERLQGRT